MNEYNDAREWHTDLLLKDLNEMLKKCEFDSRILETIDEINTFLLKTIPADSSVGIGGSVSIRELCIDRLLKERGNVLHDHWEQGLSKEEVLETRKKQLSSDCFLTSVNAVTTAGQLVNIDGVGNRVASMIFGPKHVIAVIGKNKIVKNVDEAIWRIKNISAPINCKRLGIKAPCASKGHCVECKSPENICRITTIIDRKPALTDFSIILTPLEIGY